LSDPYCLIAFTNAIDQEGLIMKYTIKHNELNNQYYVVTKNPALTYQTVTWFDTKKDAQQYVKNEIAYSKERMKDVTSIHDYFNTDQATSLRNKLAK
jgi:hypothetical protein